MSYNFISAANEMGLQIVTCSTHTPNNSPLKSYFYQAIEYWLRNHPGR